MKGLADRLGERYAHDPAFRQMVDLMTMAIRDLHLAPSEVREAATYAIYREEMWVTSRTFFLVKDEDPASS